MTTQIPDIKEKTSAALAYITLGIWGFIWLLISNRDFHSQKDFIRFHCIQSIFVGMLYAFIPQGIDILFSLVIQIVNLIPGASFIVQIFSSAHNSIQLILHYGSLALIVYCVVFCLYGKYTNIPYVSQVINRMLR